MIARRPGAELDQSEPDVILGRDLDKAIEMPQDGSDEEEAQSESPEQDGEQKQAALEEIYASADDEDESPEDQADQGDTGAEPATPPNNSRALNP